MFYLRVEHALAPRSVRQCSFLCKNPKGAMVVTQFGMRYALLAAYALFTGMLTYGQVPATELVLDDISVGQNLETRVTLKLKSLTLTHNVDVTLTSSDPERLRLSAAAGTPGKASIVITLTTPARESQEFFLQGRTKSGTVTYMASAPGLKSVTGTVTLGPSGIVVLGPAQRPSLMTTSGSSKEVFLVPMLLDSALQPVARQAIAGGLSVTAALASSNPAAGRFAVTKIALPGGSDRIKTEFIPAAAGETVLSVVASEFSALPESARLLAKVVVPGITLTENEYLGKKLQIQGVALVSEAPKNDLTMTLTSADPAKLLLSMQDTEKGSASIKLTIPAGKFSADYYLQALEDSGNVSYSASAPGYLSRTATMILAPSGSVVLGPVPFTRSGGPYPNLYVASLAEKKPVPIKVFMVFINPVTKKSGDLNLQPLHPDLSLKIALDNSDPTVGTVTTPIHMPSNECIAEGEFIPKKVGQTVLSVATPDGFSQSPNASKLTIIVQP
jgi:hypothetical protein